MIVSRIKHVKAGLRLNVTNQMKDEIRLSSFLGHRVYTCIFDVVTKQPKLLKINFESEMGLLVT